MSAATQASDGLTSKENTVPVECSVPAKNHDTRTEIAECVLHMDAQCCGYSVWEGSAMRNVVSC